MYVSVRARLCVVKGDLPVSLNYYPYKPETPATEGVFLLLQLLFKPIQKGRGSTSVELKARPSMWGLVVSL